MPSVLVGTVYSTIPAQEAGGGQLELVVQGRLMMAEAYSKTAQDLKPGSKARVVEPDRPEHAAGRTPDQFA